MDVGADVFVRLETDLLVLGGGIVPDRHDPSTVGDAPAGNDDADARQRRVGGIILPFQPSRWLRRGMERVVQERGATVCHPGEVEVASRGPELDERDPEGYHERGACTRGVNVEDPCMVLDLFGGFEDRPGAFLRRPIRFSPIRSRVDFAGGQAEGHYRRLDRTDVDRSWTGGREPLGNARVNCVANLEGCWHLSFREQKPEFVGLLATAVEFLNDRRVEFGHQLGGARNFGAGVVDCELLNPLYGKHELARVFDRRKGRTTAMDEKDGRWADEYRPASVEMLEERLAEWP